MSFPPQRHCITSRVRLGRCWGSILLVLALTGVRIQSVQNDRTLAQLIHERWETEQGLPQNSVLCLAQDLDGYIWFGTENGVVRFDGVRFEVFSEFTETAIPNSYVSSILVARDGSVWGGTRTGGLWRYRKGRFENPGPEIAEAKVSAMAQTSDGRIWIGTREGLISVKEDGQVQRFGGKDGLISTDVTAIHSSGADLWVGAQGVGVLRLEGETFRLAVSDGVLEKSGSIKALAYDKSSEELWIAHDGLGLFRFSSNALTRVDLFAEQQAEYLRALHLDSDGALWVGTENAGVVRYVRGERSYLNQEHGLPDNEVLAILRDQEGSVWVGTHFGGLNRLREGGALVYGMREGLPNEIVTCVVEENRETLWLGTKGSGLLKFSHCKFIPIPLGDQAAPNRQDVRALLRARNGDIWFGTTGGLGRYQTNENVQFFTSREGLAGDEISVLYQRKNGEIWIGTARDGISVRDGDGKFRTLAVPDEMRTHVRAFAEDSKGNLWIGTQRGLVRYSSGEFEPMTMAKGEGFSVRSLVCEADDTLWIGTRDDGLIRLQDGKLKRFQAPTGLLHNRIYQIVASETELWLAGNRGIEKVRKSSLAAVAEGREKQLNTQRFTKREGLPSSECGGDWSPSALRGADGVFWFGTRGGLVKIDPELTELAVRPPNVIVQSVEVDRRRFLASEFRGLEPGATRLQINYTALALRNPANVYFKYRLSGVDEGWVQANQSREAVYYNLRPGAYRFQVVACNDQGAWNEEGAVLSFQVAPQFYERFGFRLAAVVGLLGAIFGGYRWRSANIRRKNQELAAIVEERTGELKEEISHRTEAELQLRLLNEELETRVKARTVEVRNAYENLQVELHERQEAEQALARSEARLRRIVESGMVGILFWHRNGLISDANNTFLRMIGYTRDELENGEIAWAKLTPPEYLPLDFAALKQIEETGVCTPFEKEYIRRDGTRIPILLGGASLSADGERGVCFVLDISERKATEEQVRQLNLKLEKRVEERTAELAAANQQLAAEVLERKRVGVALAAFSHLGQNLHSARTEQEAAAIVAETAKTLIPHDICTIELYNPDGRLAPILESPPVPDQAEWRQKPQCTISVSIRNGSRVVGVIGLKSSRMEGFNYADANTLQGLGDYCGGALERIHAEEARRETERRFSIFMRNAPAIAWMKDAQFRYVFTNEMFQRFTGRQAEEIEGKSDYDLWPDHVAFHMRTNDTRTVETQAKLETQEQLKRFDGELRTLLTLRFLFTTATGEQFVAGMSVDITEQKRAEEVLHRLPQSIIEAQEAERRRVARELHDGVNQALASIKFRIQTAEQQILRSDPRWQETCGKTKDMLDSVLQQVRRLSRNLRPGELDDFGLVAAARSACQEFETRTGIVVKFTHSEFAERLPATLELSLYRIIQEALTNVEKHASATQILIDLEADETYVRLEISDNGCGFDESGEKADGKGSGLGLLHMRERASLVGGIFSMRAKAGEGVRLSIHAPIRREEEAIHE